MGINHRLLDQPSNETEYIGAGGWFGGTENRWIGYAPMPDDHPRIIHVQIMGISKPLFPMGNTLSITTNKIDSYIALCRITNSRIDPSLNTFYIATYDYEVELTGRENPEQLIQLLNDGLVKYLADTKAKADAKQMREREIDRLTREFEEYRKDTIKEAKQAIRAEKQKVDAQIAALRSVDND